MASPATRRRSRSHIETELEADTTRFAGDASPAPSDGSKRMRLRGGRGDPGPLDVKDGDEDDFDSDDNTSSTNASALRTSRQLSGHRTSATEFAPGAIVRVMLQNFVTYERAEFFPGPNLNMVIGPNGTGKSSLVCAICLGLGYPANVLGRATHYGEFVKHGKETAIVEIELQKRPQDRKNYVVKLKINRENNHRDFWVNNEPVPHKKIQKMMQTLRIQIDNLCQFLPQEKVAEFAGLNSVELLGKTLQAAAPEEMIQGRIRLQELFDYQKKMQREFENEEERLRTWQTRQQNAQADVERLREREQIKKAVDELKEVRVIADYNEKKKIYESAKEQKKKASRLLQKLEDRSKPSLEDVNKKQVYLNQIDTVSRARIQHSKDLGQLANAALEAIEKAQADIENIENEKAAAETSLAKKKAEMTKLRGKITDLEAQRKDTTVQKFSPAEWNHKIREQENRLKQELGDEQRENNNEYERVHVQYKAKGAELKRIGEEIESLDSQEGQRLQHLASMGGDAHQAYLWLQANKHEFEKEVFGPPMLMCSVKDKRYSDQVQSSLHKDDFLCFTAQTKNDHKKLTDQFYNKAKLAVTVRTITTDLASFQPPIARESLGQLGLDGYALDYIDGPSPILAMLCSEKKIHTAGVSLKEVNDQQYQRIVDGEIINSFVTGRTLYRVSRRKEYGPGATSTITRTIHPGLFWKDEAVDGSVKAEMEQRRHGCELEHKELYAQGKALAQKRKALTQQIQEAEEELTRLKTVKSQLQSDYNNWRLLPEKIDKQKREVQATETDIQEVKERLTSFADKRAELVLKKADLVIQHQESVHALRTAANSALEAQVRLVEAVSDLAALKERSADIVQRLADEKAKVNELAKELDHAKGKAREAGDAAKTILSKYSLPEGGIDPFHHQRLMDAAVDKTSASIDEDIETENAKLEIIQDADPGVLRDFEKRAREIEKLQTERSGRQALMDRTNEEIQSTRAAWEPGLDELFRKINDAFSYNFEQISCAGEVGIHKDEDFDKWAVEIKVKFRENETLQRLDQHRQSGGERAVSTIFYLMSLQSMAQSPFRVVDEINQGMDPRNERMVHERMVEIACREHTSQYFLITPKLLPSLRYDERMRVLCIASGEHMPEDGSQLDFSKCVKIKRNLLKGVAASA